MKCILPLAALLSLSACASAPVLAQRTMVASHYGSESGRHTANGERFVPSGMTAAHRTLPFGTKLRVCLHGCVVVRINDRGPAKWTRRELDLATGAARMIGLVGVGVARVEVTPL